MKKIFLYSLLFLTVLAGCTERGASSPEMSEEAGSIRRIAFYEDFQNNRVMTFEFVAGTSTEEIREHAEALPRTDGRLLAGYYYPEGSRSLSSEELKRSRGALHANDILYDTPGLDRWHYAFMRPFVGEARFTDCTESPDDVLCRKRQD